MSELETKVNLSAGGEQPLFMSEFGDWGLPDLSSDEGAFWSYGDDLSRLIESTPWPARVADFVAGSQRYQGLADRLQVELFRRTPGVIGWCVTELTDVPQEFNGLLAQRKSGDLPLPLGLRLADLATAWGSTPFIFTTSQPALTCLPGCSVLATELLSTSPEFVFTNFGNGPFAAETGVGVLKPPPVPILGTVVGRAPAMAGWLTVCQLPLAQPAAAGDPLCGALLRDLVRWAAVAPR